MRVHEPELFNGLWIVHCEERVVTTGDARQWAERNTALHWIIMRHWGGSTPTGRFRMGDERWLAEIGFRTKDDALMFVLAFR